MQFPVQQFPILTPGQMSPYNQALQSGLETYSNINKAAYEPQKMKADILAKAAYAAYTPAGVIGKAIIDPVVWGNINAQQRANALQTISNIPKNPMDILRSDYNGAGQSPHEGPITKLWNSIFGGESTTPIQQSQQPSMQSQPQQPSQGQAPSNGFQDYGSNNLATPAEVNDKAQAATANLDNNSIDLSHPSMNAFNQDFG